MKNNEGELDFSGFLFYIVFTVQSGFCIRTNLVYIFNVLIYYVKLLIIQRLWTTFIQKIKT